MARIYDNNWAASIITEALKGECSAEQILDAICKNPEAITAVKKGMAEARDLNPEVMGPSPGGTVIDAIIEALQSPQGC